MQIALDSRNERAEPRTGRMRRAGARGVNLGKERSANRGPSAQNTSMRSSKEFRSGGESGGWRRAPLVVPVWRAGVPSRWS